MSQPTEPAPAPSHEPGPDPVPTPFDALVARFGGHVDRHDGRPRWWITDPGPEATDAAATAGLVATRRLHQMRRPLPLPVPSATGDLPTRAFEPASDVDAWLSVNNAAFAWHPDQSGWTRADVERRMAEPWFDPAGFRVLDDDDRPGELAGFCWTKVHPADPGAGEPDARGEIYVIAVAPGHAGRGLGAALTVDGLIWLWEHRATPVAMLYVEHDNERALATYRRLGFTVHATDVAFERPTEGSSR